MRAYTYTIHVDRSPESVWAFLTDLTQAPNWRTMFKAMEVEGGGPLRAGANIRIVTESFGKVAERTISTIVFDAPRRWVTASASGGISGEFEYSVLPDGHGAKVTTTCDLKAHRFLAWLFLPVVARQERKIRTNQLETFKRACEAVTSAM